MLVRNTPGSAGMHGCMYVFLAAEYIIEIKLVPYIYQTFPKKLNSWRQKVVSYYERARLQYFLMQRAVKFDVGISAIFIAQTQLISITHHSSQIFLLITIAQI